MNKSFAMMMRSLSIARRVFETLNKIVDEAMEEEAKVELGKRQRT